MRTAGLVVLWGVGVAVAVAVASAGVDVVGDEIIEPAPAISVASIGSTTGQPGAVEAGGSTTTGGDGGSGDPALDRSPGTSAPAAGQTMTFSVVGGTAVIEFSPSAVEVKWATPAPGYDVDTEPEDGGVKVEFESEERRSRIDAWWAGGPQHRIREDE
jgi:hypothetical protein